MLNSRHEATGEAFSKAIEAVTTLNADVAKAALDAPNVGAYVGAWFAGNATA